MSTQINCYNCGKQNCIQNGQLWHLIYNLQKKNNNPNVKLTGKERFVLCNYMNGNVYDKKVIQQINKLYKKN